MRRPCARSSNKGPALQSCAARSVVARDACLWIAWTADHAVLQRKRRTRRIAHGRADRRAAETPSRGASGSNSRWPTGKRHHAASSHPRFDHGKAVHNDRSDRPHRRRQPDRVQLARRPAHRPGDGCHHDVSVCGALPDGIADVASACRRETDKRPRGFNAGPECARKQMQALHASARTAPAYVVGRSDRRTPALHPVPITGGTATPVNHQARAH